MIPVVHQIFDVFVLFVGVVVGFLLLLLVLVVDYNIVVIFFFSSVISDSRPEGMSPLRG